MKEFFSEIARDPFVRGGFMIGGLYALATIVFDYGLDIVDLNGDGK